jgi:hypothetical protein
MVSIMASKLKTLLVSAFVWLVVQVAALIGFGTLQWKSIYAIAASGAITKGKVVRLTPETHRTVVFEYTVSGRLFRGQRQPREPNPPLAGLKEGDDLTVFFDRQNPETSCLENPRSALRNETISVIFASVGTSTILICYFIFARRRKSHRGHIAKIT